MTPTTVLAASRAPAHPAFRWRPIDGDAVQHRRLPGSEQTACGLEGPLTLADTADTRCERGCWA